MAPPLQPCVVSRMIVHGRETSEQDRPEWNDVEQAILQMDGNLYNQVILVVVEDHYLLVGGGENELFVCEAEVPDGQYVLTNPAHSDDEVIPIMNGEVTDYVASHVVSLDSI